MEKSFFVYGTGLTARHVYELLMDKEQSEPIIFLNRTLDQYNAVSDCGECWLYTDSRITDELKQDSTVIVAIMNTQGNIRRVMENLKKEGFKKIIPYAQLADIFPDKFQFLYLESANKFRERLPQIEEAKNILISTGADHRSISVFDDMVRFRETKDYNDLPKLDKKDDQYFPRDILQYRTEKISFVDCGAYTGDTFRTMLKYAQDTNTQIVCYTGFEPDKKNFEKLEKEIKNYNNIESVIYPYAVCETRKELFFVMLGSTASKVENENNHGDVVAGVPIDEIEFSVIPTHLKMDIEGEELNALLGAEKTIRNFRPKLAVCIYHRPEDIYSIIKLIHGWKLDYKFEIRVYEDAGVDLVLYAV